MSTLRRVSPENVQAARPLSLDTDTLKAAAAIVEDLSNPPYLTGPRTAKTERGETVIKSGMNTLEMVESRFHGPSRNGGYSSVARKKAYIPTRLDRRITPTTKSNNPTG